MKLMQNIHGKLIGVIILMCFTNGCETHESRIEIKNSLEFLNRVNNSIWNEYYKENGLQYYIFEETNGERKKGFVNFFEDVKFEYEREFKRKFNNDSITFYYFDLIIAEKKVWIPEDNFYYAVGFAGDEMKYVYNGRFYHEIEDFFLEKFK